jgi:hypothetical protein
LVWTFASLLALAALHPPSDGGGVELSPPARALFSALYLCLQVTLIVTGDRRSDHAFAFQMFGESSTVRLTLLREIEAPGGHGMLVVPVHRGEWIAPDSLGTRHHFDWRDRVKVPGLSIFDVAFDAAYGARAQLDRAQAALDDVAAHIEDDAETQRLFVDVTLVKNGREPTVTRLVSTSRLGAPALAERESGNTGR